MPTSFDNEIDHTSSGISQPTKAGQKGPSPGVQIPTKNNKKTARDGSGSGGVVAAVTRSNAAKSSKNKSAVMTSQTPSPETKPVVTQDEKFRDIPYVGRAIINFSRLFGNA
ncbi:hypothetical protein DID88_006415 [Monilinia fructigena]|uniref:Uncharacterized protein n=1 Tax=Monilinia fructigena TaxID=38457 RepID=A0A395IG38_9HELO|nr:hypothetical protein DID88_006415 [Monilinia fructigena]